MKTAHQNLPVISHAGFLAELETLPDFLTAHSHCSLPETGLTWSFFRGGIQGNIQIERSQKQDEIDGFIPGWYRLRCYYFGQLVERPAQLKESGVLEVRSSGPIASKGVVVMAQLENDQFIHHILIKEVDYKKNQTDNYVLQSFSIYRTQIHRVHRRLETQSTAQSLVRFRVSVGEQKPIYPFQLSPSVLDVTGQRVPLLYTEAIQRFASLLLKHRGEGGTTSVYVQGTVDYFGQFAVQEVFRLLGVRNIWSSQENGYQAVLQAQADLLGHEGPVMTMAQALDADNALYLLSGWNGLITHLPLFDQLYQQEDADVYLFDVMVTETAKAVAGRWGVERVLLIKPGTDALLALSITHEVLMAHGDQISKSKIRQISDPESLDYYLLQAQDTQYAAAQVAAKIAAGPEYIERIQTAIQTLAKKLTSNQVPVHFQGKGPAETAGKSAYTLWNNLLALLGKIGFNSKGDLLGGMVALPTYESEHTQAQHLSRDGFFGNITLNEAGCHEAALRMGLPEDAYDSLLYHDSQNLNAYLREPAETKELVVCLGYGLDGQLFHTPLWQEKLNSSKTTLVVIDPLAGPFVLEEAALCFPTPPAVSAARLLQSSECRLTLSLPRRSQPPESRSETSILYDVLDEVAYQLGADEDLQLSHPDLALLLDSGYFHQRFSSSELGGELERCDDEASRGVLWQRIQSYLSGPPSTKGPLYCRPEDEHGNSLTWDNILSSGSLIYQNTSAQRFVFEPKQVMLGRDIYRTPQALHFAFPEYDSLWRRGLSWQLLTGASLLSDQKQNMRFALMSYHENYLYLSQETPLEFPLYVSPDLAESHLLSDGQTIVLQGEALGEPFAMDIKITDRLKGKVAYLPAHRTHKGISGQLFQLAYQKSHQGAETFDLSIEPQEETIYVS